MVIRTLKDNDIPTHIKNKALVARRRRQIVDAAVELFLKDGFHKTTTRQIARAAGISIGLLYEYIATKEDILFLVCDAIHDEMAAAVTEALERTEKGLHPLEVAIREYFLVCHRLSDHIVLIYQEIHSLPANWRKVVMENESSITGLFAQVLEGLIVAGELPDMEESALDLAAHNISVLGHMWAFRRWLLARYYTIEEYTEIQTGFLLNRYLGANWKTRGEATQPAEG
jgi:TetR/AcrR family transcriptional regulator, cholesterol catabolism regulator